MWLSATLTGCMYGLGNFGEIRNPVPVYQVHTTYATGVGQATVLARQGPSMMGRMIERGQVAIGGGVRLDTPTQSLFAGREFASGHLAPVWTGTGFVQVGVKQDVDVSLSVTAGSTAGAVPFAADVGPEDVFHSYTGEGAVAVRGRSAVGEQFFLMGGGELGLQIYPALRGVLIIDEVRTTLGAGEILSSTSPQAFLLRTTTYGALASAFASIAFVPHAWTQFELGVSGSLFTASQRSTDAFASSCVNTRCALDLAPTLGLHAGTAATAWLGATVGPSYLQLVLRGSATAVDRQSQTGSDWGAAAMVRVVLGRAPAERPPVSQPSPSWLQTGIRPPAPSRASAPPTVGPTTPTQRDDHGQ